MWERPQGGDGGLLKVGTQRSLPQFIRCEVDRTCRTTCRRGRTTHRRRDLTRSRPACLVPRELNRCRPRLTHLVLRQSRHSSGARSFLRLALRAQAGNSVPVRTPTRSAVKSKQVKKICLLCGIFPEY